MSRRRFALVAAVLVLIVAILAAFVRLRPTPGPQIRVLPDATNGIHLVQLFNYNVKNKGVETGRVDYVWGADDSARMVDVPAAGVLHGWYTFFTRDIESMSHHATAWFELHHPDWIMYGCDRRTLIHGSDWTELDISNPAVRSYLFTFMERAIDGGFDGVDFDQTETQNYQGSCGHFDAAHQWVQQYSGEVTDDAYRSAIVSAFRDEADEIHSLASACHAAFSIAINPRFDLNHPLSEISDLLPYTDIMLDEDGFTGGGYTPGNRLLDRATGYTAHQWLAKIDLYRQIQAVHKALFINAELTYRITAGRPPSADDLNWVLANYLLVKDAQTFEGYITGYQQYGGPYQQLREYSIPIGRPTGEMYQAQGVWMRNFTGGMVAVNPSPDASFTVGLPEDGLADLSGRPAGREFTLPAGSGAVLLRGTPIK